ncbi:streptothricin acetyltransferase [Bacillus sonorensis]|uniref:GNAT family N-acetyltransferase n=1 Tax=Bacillus sonorensis TaxID=119858 RepID=UPI001F5052BE|nr:GNAT family N-acetyltransferase [Bacillus sonorensis]MBG9917366.1 streptothricin acetyltransferase [Bacillus sonorensis]
MKNDFKIIEMTLKNNKDYDPNQTFMVIGRLIPKYEDNSWTYQEEIYEKPYESKYEENEDFDEYIDSEDSVVFLYYVGETCLGHIKLHTIEEIKYASIDKLFVSNSHRGKGIGTALLNRAKEWAINKGTKGFMLETQDVNLLACRFYLKNGFVIGSVDNMIYKHSRRYSNEKAVFFYLKF